MDSIALHLVVAEEDSNHPLLVAAVEAAHTSFGVVVVEEECYSHQREVEPSAVVVE